MSGTAWLARADEMRLYGFVGVFAVLALAERLWPRRGDARLAVRQAINLALMVLNTSLLRLAFPLLAVGFAQWVAEQGWGLLAWLDASGMAAALIAFALLDLAIYVQHRLFHRLPWLWRLHRVHHADLAFDVTLGVRFHPLEIALSMLIKFVVIAAIGAPPMAVLAFELVLSIGSLFTHSDLRLPVAADRVLRWVVVTPDMHRVHHSVHRHETDSNFSFHLSCWDRLFGSYLDAPQDGHTQMRIGLCDFREASEQSLIALLLNPIIKPRASGA